MDSQSVKVMDIRQSQSWSQFMENLGWQVEVADGVKIFIRKMPIFNCSSIKIQHQDAPMPLAQIDQIAKKYRALSVVIEPNLFGDEASAYLKNGYEKTDYRLCFSANIIIDLRPEEEKIFRSFSENARRNIRKAQANNLTVKIIEMKDQTDLVWFNRFYQLAKNLAKSKKFYLPYKELVAKIKAFWDSSVLLFVYDKESQEPMAAVWLAGFDQVMSYIQTGITQAGYDQLANYLMVWEGIKIAKSRGLEFFDFEGVYDPRYPKDHPRWRHFSEFKKRFHGIYQEYPPSWMKFYNRIFKYIFKCFSLLFGY